jgi:hypothetical protein
MSRALLSGVLALLAVGAGAIWFAFKSSRGPAEDHVDGSVLARINSEYRDIH